MSFFTQTQIDKIVSFAFEAGEIAKKFQESGDFVVTKKSDNSEVTTADVFISKFLNQKLSQQFPQIPIICEEGELRQFSGETFWLIDPIDGTSSFIKGSDEFAINIALIKDGKAVFGLLYAPRFEGGKIAVSNDQNQVVIIDGDKNIQILQNYAPKKEDSPLKIVTSPKTKDLEISNYIEQFHPQYKNNYTVKRLSAAVKFFPLLENKADLFISFRKMMEWDTAAGQALIEISGGKLKNLTLQDSLYVINGDLQYNKPNFTNEFFACYRA